MHVHKRKITKFNSELKCPSNIVIIMQSASQHPRSLQCFQQPISSAPSTCGNLDMEGDPCDWNCLCVSARTHIIPYICSYCKRNVRTNKKILETITSNIRVIKEGVLTEAPSLLCPPQKPWSCTLFKTWRTQYSVHALVQTYFKFYHLLEMVEVPYWCVISTSRR